MVYELKGIISGFFIRSAKQRTKKWRRSNQVCQCIMVAAFYIIITDVPVIVQMIFVLYVFVVCSNKKVAAVTVDVLVFIEIPP